MTKPRQDIINHSDADAIADIQQPEWLKQRMEWFMDQRFGFMMHWGPYSQWGCLESWPLVPEDGWARPDDLKPWNDRNHDIKRFQQDYWALGRTFNPVKFDPGPWADAAKRAGMKYVCFTTKHHDGFCMFDTATTDYRVTHPDCPFSSDPRSNITREIFDAFRARGLAASCYFSKSDWHCEYYWDPARPYVDRHPNYDTHAEPERWERFVRFVHEQIRELMSGYGKIDVLWLDGGQVRPPDQDIRMDRIAAMARELQPGLIIADRTVGGEFENFITPEQRIPDEPLEVPWESCLTMGEGWSFRPDDTYKSTRTLIHMLVEIVAKNGNFLLNIGPSPEGVLADEAMLRLQEIGDWMSVNAEAIHGTRSIRPYQEGQVRFTCRNDQIFAIVLPQEGRDRPPAEIVLSKLRPAAGVEVKLLGYDKPLEWNESQGGVSVSSRFLPWSYCQINSWP